MVAARPVRAHGRADPRARRRRPRRRHPGAAVRRRRVRLRRSRTGCSTTWPISTAALAELARVLRPGGRLVATTNGLDHMASCGGLVGRDRRSRAGAFFAETARSRSAPPLRARRAPRRRGSRRLPGPRRPRRRTSTSSVVAQASGRPRSRSSTEPLVVRTLNGVFVADKAVIRAAELIERKRDGGELSAEELTELVLGYASGDVPDYQMAAFCMAVFFRGPDARRDARADRRDGAERRDDRPLAPSSAARSSTSTRPAAWGTRRRSRSRRSWRPAACRSRR